VRVSPGSVRPVLAALAAGFALCGCLGIGGGGGDALDLVGDDTTLTPIGDGLSMAVPDGTSIAVTVDEPGDPFDTGGGGAGCSTRTGSITIDDGSHQGRIELERWSPECRSPVFLNGAHGWFASAADVPDAMAVEDLDSPAGPVTYLEHEYTECTNSCTTWPMRYALLAEAAPADSRHPLLVLVTRADNGIDLASYAVTLIRSS